MSDQNWDAGAVSDHGADAGAEHQAPGPLKPEHDDHGADHGADKAKGDDHGADHGADEAISVSDHGADRGADGVAGNLTYGSADPASE